MHFRSLHDARLQGFRRAEHHFGRFRTRGFSPVPLSTLDVRAFSRRDPGLGMCIFGRSGKLDSRPKFSRASPWRYIVAAPTGIRPDAPWHLPGWHAYAQLRCQLFLLSGPALSASAHGLVDFAKPCWPMTSIQNQICWTFRTGLPAGEPQALDAKSSDTAKEWTSLDA